MRSGDVQLERINSARTLAELDRACLENERENVAQATEIILALRRYLRELVHGLPDEHDGTAWAPIEARWR